MDKRFIDEIAVRSSTSRDLRKYPNPESWFFSGPTTKAFTESLTWYVNIRGFGRVSENRAHYPSALYTLPKNIRKSIAKGISVILFWYS